MDTAIRIEQKHLSNIVLHYLLEVGVILDKKSLQVGDSLSFELYFRRWADY